MLSENRILQNDLNSLKAVIIDDENWVHHFDPLIKSEIRTFRILLLYKNIRIIKSADKVKMIIFFDHTGVIYHPPKTTMNALIFWQHISRKCHEVVENWLLYQDNILQHVSISVERYLSKGILLKNVRS